MTPGAAGAFSRTDLLVSLAVLTTLTALAAVSFMKITQKARLNTCLANVKQIGRAVLMYVDDNKKTLPRAVSPEQPDVWWWYKEQVKGYLGLSGPSSTNDTVFACPEDRGYSDPRPFHLNPRFDYGSYVFNGVTLPLMPNISGWPLSSINQPQRTLLVMEWSAHAPVSWHKSRTGKSNLPFYCDAESVVSFVDGHVSFSKMYYDGYNAAYTRDPIAGYGYKYSGD